MNIQIITYNNARHRFGDTIKTINSFDKAMVFDDFDVNITDLTDPLMWRNKDDSYIQLNCNNDLKTLGQLISEASSSKVVLLLPNNVTLHYWYSSSTNKYRHSIHIKDVIEEIRLNVLKELYLISAPFAFGATTTMLGDMEAMSEFYFRNVIPGNIVTSNANGVATTIKNTDDDVYSTFVQLESAEMLLAFLQEIGLESNAHEAAPPWFESIKMFDDNEQLGRIVESGMVIEEQTQIINEAETKLKKNNKWKSMLYTQGSELVEVVFEVLHELLGVDLLDFEDKNREDFCFTYDNCTVIGEIKGVKNGVKNSYVSQLDNNLHIYQDNHPEDNNRKIALLIINPQRNTAPELRDAVQDDQINLAKRNKSLIITTLSMLKILEKHQRGDCSTEDCWKLLTQNTGLLSVE